jgi:beta-phosphoglucomutase
MMGIIFDCDGTLIDSEYSHFLSWKAAINKRGGDLNSEDFFSLSGQSAEFISQKLLERFKLDSAETLLEDKRIAYRALQKKGIPSIKRTLNFLHQLASQKSELEIKLAVASAAEKEEIIANLNHLGITHFFDAIVSGSNDLIHYQDPEGVNKPKPYIYLHAAKLLSRPPSQCIAFEDSLTGVLSASSAGLVTFAVPNIHTRHHDFSKATFIIDPHIDIEISEFFQKIRNFVNAKPDGHNPIQNRPMAGPNNNRNNDNNPDNRDRNKDRRHRD